MLCFRAILFIYLYFVFPPPLEPPSLIPCLRYLFYLLGPQGALAKILDSVKMSQKCVLFSEIVIIHVFICFLVFI